MTSRLSGRTVLITRTREGNAVERKKLEALGATVVELPAIDLAPPNDPNPIERAIKVISSFDWIVFTSSSGVEAFFERLRAAGKEINPATKFACVGPQTRKALEAEGFTVDLVPEEFLTKQLGIELAARPEIASKTVLMARSENANPEISEILREAGAIVVEAPVYRTIPANWQPSLTPLSEITNITLASPSAVEGLISSFRAEEINLRGIRVHSIGPVTTARAVELGLRVDSTASEHTIDGLISTIRG